MTNLESNFNYISTYLICGILKDNYFWTNSTENAKRTDFRRTESGSKEGVKLSNERENTQTHTQIKDDQYFKTQLSETQTTLDYK